MCPILARRDQPETARYAQTHLGETTASASNQDWQVPLVAAVKEASTGRMGPDSVISARLH